MPTSRSSSRSRTPRSRTCARASPPAARSSSARRAGSTRCPRCMTRSCRTGGRDAVGGQLLGRRERGARHRRRGRPRVDATAGFDGASDRDAPRRQEGRAVGHRARDRARGATPAAASRCRSPSVRVGHVPGTHELIFDAPFEQIRCARGARPARVRRGRARRRALARGADACRASTPCTTCSPGPARRRARSMSHDGADRADAARLRHGARHAVHGRRRASTSRRCARFVEWQLAEGIDFLVPCGSTGEAATLTLDEQRRVVEIIVERGGAGACRSSPAPARTTPRRRSSCRARCAPRARRTCCTSSPRTTSRRSAASPRTSARSPTPSTCRSCSTTCRAAPASNIEAETTLRARGGRERRRGEGGVGRPRAGARDPPRPAGRLRRALRRRRAHARHHGARRRRAHLRRVERDAAADGRALRACAAGDLVAARALHARLAPWMRAAFVESNPIPVKAALAMLGRMQNVLRLPLVPLDRRASTASSPRRCTPWARWTAPSIHRRGSRDASTMQELQDRRPRSSRDAVRRPRCRATRPRPSSSCSTALERGELRAAARDADGRWHAVPWVKRGILLGVPRRPDRRHVAAGRRRARRIPVLRQAHVPAARDCGSSRGVRVVPGGSTIRRGAYLAPGVVCMPPMYVNVGAWVGRGHDGRLARARRLVRADRRARAPERRGADRRRARAGERVARRHRGRRRSSAATAACTRAPSCARAPCSPPASCSRAARRCTISCARRVYRATPDAPLEIPEGAVVVPGARRVRGDWGEAQGLSLQTPVIVKYRDERTDLATALEAWLR